MAVIITDELRLLIKAEATQALKEILAYKSGIEDLNEAQTAAAKCADEAGVAENGYAEAMKKARTFIAQTKNDLQDEALARDLVAGTLGEQEKAQQHLEKVLGEARRLKTEGLLTEEQYCSIMAREAQAVYDLSSMAKDRASAEQMVSGLLSAEQIAQKHLNDTMAEASRLRSEGLLTEEQYNQMLQQETVLVEDASGKTGDRVTAQQMIAGALSDGEVAQKNLNETLAEATRLYREGLLSEKEYQSVTAHAKTAYSNATAGTASYAAGLKQVESAQGVVKTGSLAMGKAIMTALGPFASIAGAVMLVKKLVGEADKAYAESEGEVRKFSITYRDVADDAEEAARTWADTFDYAESTAKSILGSAGDLYTGMGMTAGVALELAERTSYLGGALSKLNPQIGGAEEATKALITATTGEREALKTWGIIIQESAVQAKLLERGQQDLAGSALLNAKAQATLDIAYEQSPNALAAVTDATQLAADTNRALSEAWKEHQELAGKQINSVFQPMKKALAGYIKDLNEARKAQDAAMEVDPHVEVIEQYGKTADKVDSLVDAYESLREKAVLTKDEQDDLKDIMAELGTLVPSAVTAWDDYGKAIGASVTVAREFATQQRALRIAETEYQLLRLQFQQQSAKADYEDNKRKKGEAEDGIRETGQKVKEMQSVYTAAKMVSEMLENPSADGGGFAGALDYLRTNAEALKGTYYDITKVEVAWDPFSYLQGGAAGTIASYDALQKKMESLKTDQAKYALGTKEYEVYTEQIRQAEAALGLLGADQKEETRLLEQQLSKLPQIAGGWNELKRSFLAGQISADGYNQAMRSLLDSAGKTPDPIVPPDTSAWDDFVKNLTGGSGLKEAIDLQVELSPIMEQGGGKALEAQLARYGDLIGGLWAGKAKFSSSDDWKQAMDELVGLYKIAKDEIDATALTESLMTPEQKAQEHLNEAIEQATALKQKGLISETDLAAVVEKERKAVDDASGLTERRAKAQTLITGTLSEEQKATQELADLETEVLALKTEGLLTDGQCALILQQKQDDLDKLLGKATSFDDFVKESWKDIKENYFSLEAISGLLSDTFADIGSALGSGDDVLAASGKALQAFTSSLLGDLSSMAIGAGLRLIVEGGMAALPAAIGLFALGGLAGIGSGFFGSSGAGVDSGIKDALSAELDIRESLNEALTESLDIEQDLLKRQLDRNLISEEDYVSGITEINSQRNQGDAQSSAVSKVQDKIDEIDAELSDMSGWTKFWTQKDETLQGSAAELAALAKEINQATTAAELKSLIAQLKDYGIDIDDLPAFATGGSFITNGEQAIVVGDNASGRELVNITPLGSSGGASSGDVTIININGPVLDYDDLVAKLDQVGIKLEARGRRVSQ